MPRNHREKSALGIYHVMLRGINKQDIFFNEDDFVRMMTILKNIPYKRDISGTKVLAYNQCHIYAYCILHNHLHILIREDEMSISDIMKSIEISYAQYYNRKYERIGHLYQGRFQSEAINDSAYFHTVFRYIARNPVKALEAKHAEEYPYSSWNEFVENKSNVMKVLNPSAIQAVLKKYPLDELAAWINEDNDDKCMDMDDFINIKSDKEAWEILSDSCGYTNPEDFRSLDPQTQIYYLLDAISHGINPSQAARLGTITRYQIRKVLTKKRGVTSPTGPGPVGEKSVEINSKDSLNEVKSRIKLIRGLGKKTYQQLHQIVEYLYTHSPAKCTDIADYLDLSSERTRIQLVLLLNENIIETNGTYRNRIYYLKTVD